MKIVQTLIVLSFIVSSGKALAADTIISFNLLCAEVCTRDPELYEPWAQRKTPVLNLIAAENADLMALQEIYGDMLGDIEARFGADYQIYTGTLDDQSTEVRPGHLNIILVRKTKYKIAGGGSFRLGKRPGVNANRVQDAYRRTCTWALLESKTGFKERFRFLSCHFPFDSKEQSEVAAQTLVDWLWTTDRADLPQIVAGDFNRSPVRDSIEFITGPRNLKPEFSYPVEFRPLVDPIDIIKINYIFHSGQYRTKTSYLSGTEPYSGDFQYSDHPMVVLRGRIFTDRQRALSAQTAINSLLTDDD